MAASHKQIKNIWMLSREYGELAGAGGVKDVACQLAESVAKWNNRSVNVVLPCYGFMDARGLGFERVQDPLFPQIDLHLMVEMHQPDKDIYEEVWFYHRKSNKVNIFLVDTERYRQKNDIYTYTEEDEKKQKWQKKSSGHHDYFAMNVLLQKASLDLMIALEQKPDVIHCHDGHTALLPALINELQGYRTYFRGTGCLVTIHNAGHGYHQEIADNRYAKSITGLSEDIIQNNQLDLKFDPFLVAGQYALLNTVSENYARELQETESDELTGWLGHELKSRNIELSGVTNGIDPDSFIHSLRNESATDEFTFFPELPSDDMAGKRRCKVVLLDEIAKKKNLFGVETYGHLTNDADMVLFTFVGRLSEQKGVDLLIEVMSVWMKQATDVQLLVLGSGAVDLERQLIKLTDDERLRGRICYLKGYSSKLANNVYAAGDYLVIPSRYEPCGLTDFIGQLFGNIPVVHHVGGLVKVLHDVTGIAYNGNNPDELLKSLTKAHALYGDPVAKRKMQQRAVEEIQSKYIWKKVMRKYLTLYAKAAEMSERELNKKAEDKNVDKSGN